MDFGITWNATQIIIKGFVSIGFFPPVLVSYDGFKTGSCPFICHSKGFSLHCEKNSS